jgi:hypothetical protein
LLYQVFVSRRFEAEDRDHDQAEPARVSPPPGRGRGQAGESERPRPNAHTRPARGFRLSAFLCFVPPSPSRGIDGCLSIDTVLRPEDADTDARLEATREAPLRIIQRACELK